MASHPSSPALGLIQPPWNLGLANIHEVDVGLRVDVVRSGEQPSVCTVDAALCFCWNAGDGRHALHTLALFSSTPSTPLLDWRRESDPTCLYIGPCPAPPSPNPPFTLTLFALIF